MSAGFVKTRQSHFAFEVLAGLDINEDALATYRQNTGALGITVDIRKLAARPERLKHLIPGWDPTAMRPLVFVGCPPCQGFSALRKGDERDDARNDLSLAFAKIAKHFRPDLIVMENVPEVLRGRFSHHFAAAATIMERDGYKFASAVLDLEPVWSTSTAAQSARHRCHRERAQASIAYFQAIRSANGQAGYCPPQAPAGRTS